MACATAQVWSAALHNAMSSSILRSDFRDQRRSIVRSAVPPWPALFAPFGSLFLQRNLDGLAKRNSIWV
eukprot:Skav210072  [mRNA]  locus=scaffold485:216902:217108:- [translate_table: standard]